MNEEAIDCVGLQRHKNDTM